MEQERVIARLRPCAGVVLAAGESRRMGAPKLLLPLAGDTVLGRTLANSMAGGISPLTVVCGAYAAEIAAQAQAKGLPHLYNSAYASGQSSSLIAGLAAVPQGYGAMFILGDQPFVMPQSYAALAQAYAQSEALIVAPQYPGGRHGNPVIVAPQLFAKLRLLSGDTGARALLQQYQEQTLFLPLEEQGMYKDIDTREEYELYCQKQS